MPVFKIRFSSVYVEMKRKVADSRQLNATIVMGGKAEFCTNNKALLAAMTAFPNVKYSILNPFDFHKEGREWIISDIADALKRSDFFIIGTRMHQVYSNTSGKFN